MCLPRRVLAGASWCGIRTNRPLPTPAPASSCLKVANRNTGYRVAVITAGSLRVARSMRMHCEFSAQVHIGRNLAEIALIERQLKPQRALVQQGDGRGLARFVRTRTMRAGPLPSPCERVKKPCLQ